MVSRLCLRSRAVLAAELAAGASVGDLQRVESVHTAQGCALQLWGSSSLPQRVLRWVARQRWYVAGGQRGVSCCAGARAAAAVVSFLRVASCAALLLTFLFLTRKDDHLQAAPQCPMQCRPSCSGPAAETSCVVQEPSQQLQ